MADAPDVNLATWGLGAVTAALGTALGWLWRRQDRAEDRMSAEAAALRKEISDEDAKLWTAMTNANDRAQQFREATLKSFGELPTKQDLRDMEARLVASMARPHA